jgi:serine/threonine protein kinase
VALLRIRLNENLNLGGLDVQLETFYIFNSMLYCRTGIEYKYTFHMITSLEKQWTREIELYTLLLCPLVRYCLMKSCMLQVIEHKPYDHKADVFSFGILLWELLTGKVCESIFCYFICPLC